MKGTKADGISETVFFKHTYLTNTTVKHADKVVNAARALYEALSKKKQGIHNNTMESLKKRSHIFLTTAKSTEDSIWEEPVNDAPPKPVTTSQVQTRLSRLAVSLANTKTTPPHEQDIPAFWDTRQLEPAPSEVRPPEKKQQEKQRR